MPKTKLEIVEEIKKDVEEVVEEIAIVTKAKPKVHYIDNERFLKELLLYFDNCRIARERDMDEPRIPEYIGECFYKIGLNLSRKPNFMNYSYRDEMVMDGVENCLMYFRNFDPAKGSNPFSYFTQIIYFAFIRRIGKEKKQSYIKYKIAEQFGSGVADVEPEDNDMSGGRHINSEALYDNMADYIHTFEEKVEEKKRKRKSKKDAALPDSNDGLE